MKHATLGLLILALVVTAAPAAIAQVGGGISKQLDHPSKSGDVWTPERMAKARPLPLPTATDEDIERLAPHKATTVNASSSSAPPRVSAPDLAKRLFDLDMVPDFSNTEWDALRAIAKNRGNANMDFTSTRLIPLDADQVWPYTTVGKLFFSQSSGDFVCSAAAISRRVVLTAGHCVHDGMGGGASGFFDSFRFVPAYRDGSAPFGEWFPTWVTTSNSWANGGGIVPAADDIAIFVMFDDGQDRAIGDVIGWLGWRTNKTKPNHVTMLGYPGNLDNGQKMHQVSAGKWKKSSAGTWMYGSDMRGGSSGGPWVQNFNLEAEGQEGGKNSNPRQVVGVTSFGAVSKKPMRQGSSTLGDVFLSLWDAACEQGADNCV